MAHEFSSARSLPAKWSSGVFLLLMALLGGAACASESPPPKAPPPTKSVPTPEVVIAAAVSPSILVKAFRLGSKVEIRPTSSSTDFPQPLSQSELEHRFLPQTPKAGLWAMLDQHPARSFASRKLKFTDLLNEDEELAPGFHWLSLFQESGSDAEPVLEVSLSAVAVESEPEGMPLAPGCALLWPVGTYNGPDAAAQVRVLAVPRQSEVTAIDYEARSGDWVSQGRFPVGQVVLLDAPPDGDVVVSATCLMGEEILSLATQTITINSDTTPIEATP